MKIDAYIFLRFVVIFSEFFKAIYVAFCVYHPRPIRDIATDVPTESAAETTTLNHAAMCLIRGKEGSRTLIDSINIGLLEVFSLKIKKKRERKKKKRTKIRDAN